MSKLDRRKLHKALFAPPAGLFVLVEVPVFQFVKVDGRGDPNTAAAYREAVEWLYSVSYGMKFAAKSDGHDYVVPPLQGLWWADDLSVFTTGDRDAWRWTMMIMAPDFVDGRHYEAGLAKAAKKLSGASDAALRRVR